MGASRQKQANPSEPDTIHRSNLMRLLGLNRASEFDGLVNTGKIIPTGRRGFYKMSESITNCSRYWRGLAAGHKTDGYEVVKESALLKQSHRQLADLKAAKLRGDMVSISEIFPLWAEAVKDVRSLILTFPTRVQAVLPHLIPAEIELVKRCAHEALSEFKAKGDRPPGTPAPDEKAT